MTARLLRKLMLFGILATFVLAMTPPVGTAGDGPEPGPPGTPYRYIYVPPPFIGDGVHLKLLLDEDNGTAGVYIVEGTACQVGKPGCCIVFDNYLVADVAELWTKGLLGISCTELKPQYFLGEYTEVPSTGVAFKGECGDFPSEVQGVDFIAVGDIRCVEGESGVATEGWARIILMGWAVKY